MVQTVELETSFVVAQGRCARPLEMRPHGLASGIDVRQGTKEDMVVVKQLHVKPLSHC